MMHSKIQTEHSCTRFIQSNAATIYVADFSERTKLYPPKRSVEVSHAVQMSPDGRGPIDSTLFHNDNQLDIELGLFEDSTYHDLSGANIEHCEGTMYVANIPDLKWVAFLEIKDCLPKNVKNHKKKSLTQIQNVVNDFKARGIITTENVIGIISCPQKKVAFNSTIVGDMVSATALKRSTGINFYGTNEVFIVSKEIIRPKI